MILNREKGGYLLGAVVRLSGSFQTDGSNDPGVIRDGNSACIESVTRLSAGVFEVKFRGASRRDEEFAIPELPVAVFVSGSFSNGDDPYFVMYEEGSYSQAARSFKICTFEPALGAPDDPSGTPRISFEIVGSIDSSGVDPA